MAKEFEVKLSAWDPKDSPVFPIQKDSRQRLPRFLSQGLTN
jgi:hypothetical protein